MDTTWPGLDSRGLTPDAHLDDTMIPRMEVKVQTWRMDIKTRTQMPRPVAVVWDRIVMTAVFGTFPGGSRSGFTAGADRKTNEYAHPVSVRQDIQTR